MSQLPDAGAEPAPRPATEAAAAVPDVATVPLWAMASLAALAALVTWLVGFDNGQITGVLDSTGNFAHELFHDGRHMLGVPCH